VKTKLDDISKNLVQAWAERWRNLRAWGRPLTEIRPTVRKWSGRGRMGFAHTASRETVIFVPVDPVRGPDIPYTLSTVLHEYAHLSDPNTERHSDGHGESWKRRFAAAIEEVTGIGVITTGMDTRAMDELCSETVKRWWKDSNNAFIESVLRKGAAGR
jgi:hypothetical protein